MFWLFRAARRLKELGIMGMNRRNAEFILDYNDRTKFPIVDDKLRMRDVCLKIGVPTPEIYRTISSPGQLRRLEELLGTLDDFVVKPNRGSGGRGVLVVVGKDGKNFLRHNGHQLPFEH